MGASSFEAPRRGTASKYPGPDIQGPILEDSREVIRGVISRVARSVSDLLGRTVPLFQNFLLYLPTNEDPRIP